MSVSSDLTIATQQGIGMKTLALLALFIAAGNAFAFQEPAVPSHTHHESQLSVSELRDFWNQYQEAVKQKDTKKLLRSYLNDSISVIGGIAPKSYAVISAANKQPIPRFLPLKAKDNAAGEAKLPPDVTSHLQIQTDGEVGTLSWDYTAAMGHGQITWTVVRTNDGWKIASIIYSINVPAADKSA
jgi:hypothetical protein